MVMIVTRCIDQIWESFHLACQVSIFMLENSQKYLLLSLLCWSFTCWQLHFIHAYIPGNKLILWLPFSPTEPMPFQCTTPRLPLSLCLLPDLSLPIIALKVCLNSTRPRNKTGPSCKFKQEHFELHTDTKTC